MNAQERPQASLVRRMYRQEKPKERTTAQHANSLMYPKQSSGKGICSYRKDSQDAQVKIFRQGTSQSSTTQSGEDSVHGTRWKAPVPESKPVGIIEGMGMFKQPLNDAAITPFGKAKILQGARKTESQQCSSRHKPSLPSEEGSSYGSSYGSSGDLLDSMPCDRESCVGSFRLGING
ncbi:hypothetical protein MMC10_004545 [Thelotrema lepadinum]|nr:hypothetical protein [Thelotrema lepadinum]